MTSKGIFFWSKRQSSAEPYYRTGGLLPIDTSPNDSSNGSEIEGSPESARKRQSTLKIIPPDNKQFTLNPPPAPYSTALVHAASNLQAAFNDLLRSPLPSAAACKRASTHKPLPGRPRSVSVPSTPVELPGSILLENQGFPSPVVAENTALLHTTPQNVRISTHPPDTSFESDESFSDLLNVPFGLLSHARSAPDLAQVHDEMRSVRSGNALNAAAQPSPLKVQRKKSLSDASLRRHSKPSSATSPSSTDNNGITRSIPADRERRSVSTSARAGADKLVQRPPIVEEETWTGNAARSESRRREPGTTAVPATSRDKQIEELESTIAAQNRTISTLHAQFSGLRASHEAHVGSLAGAHLREVASVKDHAKALEEQSAHRPNLHHSSSNNLLFIIDTSEPQTPTLDSPHTVEIDSATSTKSFQSALEKQQRSPQRSQNSPEMESLKRKLSTTRRPETATRNFLPELNQYKQNTVALQKQIESLMAKLNESKKNERSLKSSLDEAEEKCTEWQGKAEAAEKHVKSAQALQNTIDHLENRLEVANTERLDAEEQLFNLQAEQTPFDVHLLKLQVPSSVQMEDRKAARNAHLSMSTVFSSGSPTSPENEPQGMSTLAAFIAHIERLQDQVRQKDAQITELEADRECLRDTHSQLEQEHHANHLQMDIQNQLLEKARTSDAHVEQLRTAVINREAIIGMKEKAMRAIERQLEQHKLLLQAEIRRHAKMTLHAGAQDDPLPDLSKIAGKADIDRWIAKLQDRLQNGKPAVEGRRHPDPRKALMNDMRQEIDFYIREIIYYKLDIKGYKSDIKKLKKITQQLSTYGSRTSDLESDSSSLRPAMTPNLGQVTSTTPEIGVFDGPLPGTAGTPFSRVPLNRPITPPSSTTATVAGFSPVDDATTSQRGFARYLKPESPMTPRTPTRIAVFSMGKEYEHMDNEPSPRAVVEKPSPEQNEANVGKHTTTDASSTIHPFRQLPWGGLERDGYVPEGSITHMPNNMRQRHGRSMSESAAVLYATAGQTSLPTRHITKEVTGRLARSSSLSNPSKGGSTPERPPRPRYGLFEIRHTTTPNPITPSCEDISVEASHDSPGLQALLKLPPISRPVSNASIVRVLSPPIQTDLRNSVANSSPSVPAATPLLRAGSASSRKAEVPTRLPTPSERKLSAASSSSIPFVIAMGSPHNPALITPVTNMLPTPCSITRYAPLKITPIATSRAGVGGTMASSTPVGLPLSPCDAPVIEPPPRPSTTKPILGALAPLTRSLSLSKKQEQDLPRPPRTPSHSRTASGSSIRTAIRLPKAREKEYMAHRARKDSISMPQPLGSPFSADRSAPMGANQKQKL